MPCALRIIINVLSDPVVSSDIVLEALLVGHNCLICTTAGLGAGGYDCLHVLAGNFSATVGTNHCQDGQVMLKQQLWS